VGVAVLVVYLLRPQVYSTATPEGVVVQQFPLVALRPLQITVRLLAVEEAAAAVLERFLPSPKALGILVGAVAVEAQDLMVVPQVLVTPGLPAFRAIRAVLALAQRVVVAVLVKMHPAALAVPVVGAVLQVPQEAHQIQGHPVLAVPAALRVTTLSVIHSSLGL
jgi:hypothetical protein